MSGFVIFAPDNAAKVMAGTKTVTRRPVKDGAPCRYVAGRTYAVQPGLDKKAIGRVLIHTVRREPLGLALIKPEPYLEGYAIAEGFRRAWEGLHGSFDPDQEVWRLGLEVVRGG